VQYAKQMMQQRPDIDFYVFGHRHIELDLMLSQKARVIILGDWLWQFTYAVFDGEHLSLDSYDVTEPTSTERKG